MKIAIDKHVFASGSKESKAWTLENINTERVLLDSPEISMRRMQESPQDLEAAHEQSPFYSRNIVLSNYNNSQEDLDTKNAVENDFHLNAALTDFDYMRTPQKSIEKKERVSASESQGENISNTSAKRIYVLSALRKSEKSEREKEFFEGG